MKIKDPCILCSDSIEQNAHSPLWLKGNNARPLAEGQCCDPCNAHVITERIINIMSSGPCRRFVWSQDETGK